MGCVHWAVYPAPLGHRTHSCRDCAHGSLVRDRAFEERFRNGICSHCHASSANPIRGCFFEPRFSDDQT